MLSERLFLSSIFQGKINISCFFNALCDFATFEKKLKNAHIRYSRRTLQGLINILASFESAFKRHFNQNPCLVTFLNVRNNTVLIRQVSGGIEFQQMAINGYRFYIKRFKNQICTPSMILLNNLIFISGNCFSYAQ